MRYAHHVFATLITLLLLSANDAADEPKPKSRDFSLTVSAGGSFILSPRNNNWFNELYAEAKGLREEGPSGTPFSSINPMLSIDAGMRIKDQSWYIKTGLNLALVNVQRETLPVDEASVIDEAAVGGNAIWVEGLFGVRYYFLTERVRPHLGGGLRLTGLVYTSAVVEIMPVSFRVMLAPYAEIGSEIMLSSIVGLSITARYSYFIVVNFPGMHMLEGQAGAVVYF